MSVRRQQLLQNTQSKKTEMLMPDTMRGMTNMVRQAIEVLRNLPEEKAEIAAAAIINIAAAHDDERE